MRERELLARFREWRGRVEGTWVLNMAESEAARLWAQGLGVPVEPDEPELPEQIHWSACHDGPNRWEMKAGPTMASVLREHGGPNEVALAFTVTNLGKRYLDAAFAAYNASREGGWRTGYPLQGGKYIVRAPHSGRVTTDRWSEREGWTGGSVAGWMPLPE